MPEEHVEEWVILHDRFHPIVVRITEYSTDWLSTKEAKEQADEWKKNEP